MEDQEGWIAPRSLKAAAEQAAAYLRERTGLPIWVVSRVRGDDLEAVHLSAPEAHDLPTRVPRALSMAGLMVDAGGPRVAPRIDDEPAYSNLPRRGLGAFVGAPIVREDGFLFGTLSGFAHQPAGPELEAHLPIVELMADLLGRVWSADLRASEAEERARRAEDEARRDSVTGVATRRSWDETVEAEEVRCRRYGHPASILLADLDGLKRVNDQRGHAEGDRLLRETAKAIVSATRSGDVVARLGGDEFGILAVESDEEAAEALAERVRAALVVAGVEASVGLGTRERAGTLKGAWARADEAMYESKRRRGHGGAA